MKHGPIIATAAFALAASASVFVMTATASGQGLRDLLGDRAENRGDFRDQSSDRSASRDDLRDLLRDRLERCCSPERQALIQRKGNDGFVGMVGGRAEPMTTIGRQLRCATAPTA
jgi:hypothetical protein